MDDYLDAMQSGADFGRYFTVDVRWTTVETGDEVHGRDAVRYYIVALHTEAHDAHPEVKNLVVGDGGAVLEADLVGTHTGDFAVIPATGASIRVPYAVAYDVSPDGITALRVLHADHQDDQPAAGGAGVGRLTDAERRDIGPRTRHADHATVVVMSDQARSGRNGAARRSGGGDGFLTLVTVLLLVKAVRQQLQQPAVDRTWHGVVPVEVPYELRPPTLSRLRQRLWDPSEPRLFVPTVFGVGWTVNLARLLRRGRS